MPSLDWPRFPSNRGPATGVGVYGAQCSATYVHSAPLLLLFTRAEFLCFAGAFSVSFSPSRWVDSDTLKCK